MMYPIWDQNAGAVSLLRLKDTPDGRFADRLPSDRRVAVVRTGSGAAAVLSGLVSASIFYEVIQVRAGVPLFWDDHMARLTRSLAAAAGFSADVGRLERDAAEYLALSGVSAGNLKLVLTDRYELMHWSVSAYPTPAMFEHGVDVGVLSWVRHDPNVKQVHADYKRAVASAFEQPGPFGPYYELLLADPAGRLTEGSRSNLFFTSGKTVYSAPSDLILEGITRRYVLRAVEACGFRLSTRMLTLGELTGGQAADGAMITSSPFDVLPVRSVVQHRFDRTPSPAVRQIQTAFAGLVADALDRDRCRFRAGWRSEPPAG